MRAKAYSYYFIGSGFLAAPEFVDQHRAHRVNIEVAIEFEASAIAAAVIFERESPVVVVQPREPILTAQREATAQPSH